MNTNLTVAIVGVGLIGGSLALEFKHRLGIKKVYGIDKDPQNLRKALELGLVDEAVSLDRGVRDSDLIVLSVPVDALPQLALEVLDMVDNQVVIDVGSTKVTLIKAIKNHPRRKRFVATHPMAGTEYSGPKAAMIGLFTGKKVLVVDAQDTDRDALSFVKEIYRAIGMNISYIDSDSHDLHAAYVSHISHISSFVLALTVLDKEQDENNILDMAGGGFRSTVRLANSAASMWTPIFLQNRDNMLDVLDAYIDNMLAFRQAIASGNKKDLNILIHRANMIYEILNITQPNILTTKTLSHEWKE